MYNYVSVRIIKRNHRIITHQSVIGLKILALRLRLLLGRVTYTLSIDTREHNVKLFTNKTLLYILQIVGEYSHVLYLLYTYGLCVYISVFG